jgi:CBS domain-containing protein
MAVGPEELSEDFETDPFAEEDSREVKLRRGLLTAPITLLDPRPAVTVGRRTSVADAVTLMNRERIGAVLVTEHARLVGIFTERDVLTKIAGRGYDFSKLAVEDYMTPDPEALEVHARVAYALNMMVVGGYRHVPLVDQKGRAVAMLSVRDIVEFMVEMFPKDVLNLPADPDHEMRSPYGG